MRVTSSGTTGSLESWRVGSSVGSEAVHDAGRLRDEALADILQAEHLEALTARDLLALTAEEFGDFLTRRVFHPGAIRPWPEFVRQATGKPFSARYFVREVR